MVILTLLERSSAKNYIYLEMTNKINYSFPPSQFRVILKLSMICGENFSLLRHGIHLLGVFHVQEGVLSTGATRCSSPSQEGSFLHFFGTRFNPIAKISRSPLSSMCILLERKQTAFSLDHSLLNIDSEKTDNYLTKFFQCSIRRLENPASYWQFR